MLLFFSAYTSIFCYIINSHKLTTLWEQTWQILEGNISQGSFDETSSVSTNKWSLLITFFTKEVNPPSQARSGLSLFPSPE